VKLLVGPGFASRYQAWKFQVPPGWTIVTTPHRPIGDEDQLDL
jgi:hypothetical protein